VESGGYLLATCNIRRSVVGRSIGVFGPSFRSSLERPRSKTRRNIVLGLAVDPINPVNRENLVRRYRDLIS